MSNGVSLKVYSELGSACLREGWDKHYRLWTIARSLDERGSGRVSEAALVEFVGRLGDVKGLSRDYLRRLLKSGEGMFWTLYRKRGALWIRLHSLYRVSRALGVRRHYRRPIIVGVEGVCRLSAWRGSILAAQLATRHEWTQPISRRVLEQRTGYSARSQRRWTRAVDGMIDRRKCGALLDWSGPIDADRLRESNAYVDLWAGKRRIVRRLPNAYRVNVSAARRGMLRRVNEFLSAAVESVTICLTDEQNRKPKLFYAEGQTRQINRRLQECSEGDVFFEQGARVGRRKAKRTQSGCYLYGQYSIVDGAVCYG